MLSRAIVRPPAANFGKGLTTAGQGAPDYKLALEQHEAYCVALERCGLTLVRLDADPNFPDSTFVEDAAIASAKRAILTRPGAVTRSGEVESMRSTLGELFSDLSEIKSPGTLDGGDVCEAGNNFFIGVSQRTNETGAKQLAIWLSSQGCKSSLIDIRKIDGLLHLKSGVAYLGDNRLLVTESLRGQPGFGVYDLVMVDAEEAYAANCVRINEYVLIAAGHPKIENKLRGLGYQTIALRMSEFRKMDGGLSCLSLRF